MEQEGLLFAVTGRVDDDWYWLFAAMSSGRNATSPPFVITNDLMRDHKFSFLTFDSFIRWRNSQIVYFAMNRSSFINFKTNTFALARVLGKKHLRTYSKQKLQACDDMSNANSQDDDDDEVESTIAVGEVLSDHDKEKSNGKESVITDVDGITEPTASSTEREEINKEDSIETVQASTDSTDSPTEDWEISGDAHFFPPGNFSREIQFSPESNHWHVPAVDRNVWLCLALSHSNK